MADNESTVSMDAEISLSTNNAVSELNKLTKQLNNVSDSIVKSVKHLDEMLEKLVKIGQVGGKAISEMSKVEVKDASAIVSSTQSSNGNISRKKRGKKSNSQSSKNNASVMQDKLEDMLDDGIDPETAKQYAALIRAYTANQVASHQEVINAIEQSKQQNASMRNSLKAKQQELDAAKIDARKQEIEVRKENNRTTSELNQSKKTLNEAKALNQEASAEANKARKIMYQAKAAQANDDFRFEAGWRGGIASGIGGAISRARARSGFAGFAARVGTGVGQLHPELNIMKGATLSGLGLNPLTLAFATVGAGIAKLTEGLGKLGVESLQAYGEVEKLKTGLSVVFGSDTEANTMFEGIKEYSLASPFGVEQTTEMATLLKQSGIYGTELLDTMKMIGDTAGGNEEKFRRIANNYAQIASIGKASMLDMRQFAYAGIPIYKKVAEELGVSQSVLRQMISDGEVTNEVIEKVFKTMTSEGGEFYKAVERGAETLNARLVNLKDSMNMAKAGIGEWLFKLDIVGIGNSSDNQGSLGHLLNFVEELARKADDWATLRNIERDVNAISTRETVSGEIQGAIREAMLRGQDTTALQNLHNKVSGMDTLESNRDTYTQYNKYYQDIAERATTENYNNLQAQLEAARSMSTRGKSDEFREWRKSTIKSLEEEIDFIKDYLPRYTEAVTEISRDSGFITVNKEYQGKKFAELQEALAITNPYLYQTQAQELATRMFERGQKTAAASSSLTSFAEQSRQKYLETEQGKDELEAKERAEYEKYARQFNSLRPLVDDTGNIIDDMRINIGQFVELMESGLIEPLEKVSVTWDALAVNTSDTTSQSRDKVDTWQGMASRADDISHLLYILPMELQDSFRSIFDVLANKDMNTKENVTELNKYMSDLENSQMFNANKNAQNLLQYLLTSNASVLSKIYSYDELKGKGEDNIPLWKRITGSALGVDPSFITNAKDFHELYGRKFVGRNISQGVISGMVSSGRSTREISNRLRFTGQRAQDGTLLIDWERTAESMAMFATSTNASLVEMNAYKDALRAQIDTYGKLKETMFTMGEDWEKLDSKKLEEQLFNAFSGIDGSKMIATNATGVQRELTFNEDNELVFKDTGELYAAQQEFMFSTEESANALDKFSGSLLDAYQKISLDTITQETIQSKGMQIVSDSISGYSAQMFLEGKVQNPDTLLNALGPHIDTLLKEQTEKPDEYNQRFSKDNIDALKLSMGDFLTSFTDEDLRNIDFVKANLERAKDVQKEYGDFSESGEINEGTEAGIFVDAIKKYTDAMLAASVQLDKEGNTVGSEQEIANLLEIKTLFQPDLIDIVDKQLYTARTVRGREDFARQVSPARFYQSAKKDVEKNVRKQLGLSEDDKLSASAQMLYDRFMALADSLGVVDVDLQNFKETLQYDYEKQYSEAKSSGDLAGMAQANLEKALNDLATATKEGGSTGAAVGDFAGAKFQEMGANLIQGTDVGAFVQGTAMGGPIVGLINMLMNAIGNVVGGMEVLEYTLNPVTNLLQGLAPLLKMTIFPLVVISRGLEMLGEAIEKALTWILDGIFGEGTMESIDYFYDSLTDSANKMEETAQRLEALNEMLDKTRQSIMEAEEYFLVQNRNANAQWAAQMQGQFVMDTRTQKVNDMILTPHGNFSTAPDDYILAMKDPASLMRNTGSNANVVVKFTVNNNASDVVEAQAEERIGADGQKELMVTISRMVASDYASGKNGWDSAYSGRESRMKGRRVSR
jgi:tape measure domain-containing protein